MTELTPSRYGEFYTYTNDLVVSESLRRYGEWAQMEVDFLLQFISEGDVVVDAGAFIGTHTRPFSIAAGPSGSVIAIEPRKSVHEVLAMNCQMAVVKNITAMNCALGQTRWRSKLMENDLSNPGAYSLSTTESSDPDAIDVKTLDDLELKRLMLLKADVEGMEHDVLLGGKNTIDRCRPAIFLEVNSVALGAKLLGWASDHSYSSFAFLSPAFNEFNFVGSQDNVFGTGSDAGILLLPAETADFKIDQLHLKPVFQIEDLDDLVLLMVNKTQYRDEYLSRRSTRSATKLPWPAEPQYLEVKLKCAHEALAQAYSLRPKERDGS